MQLHANSSLYNSCWQLRHEFDSGRHVHLTEDQHVVHDVASLLKEFLRDLPDPLLTRDLYTAFLATACESLQRTFCCYRTFNNARWLSVSVFGRSQRAIDSISARDTY